MDPVTRAGAAAPPTPAQRAARQLEASFATEMLRSARPQPKEDGKFGGGIGARSFNSFLDDALGEAMVARGGLGLAPQIERAIREGRGTGAAGGVR